MKTFLLVVLCVSALFLWQRQSDRPAAPAKGSKSIVVPATPRPASKHNWMKRPIDRARAVSEGVKKSRHAAEQP